MGTWAFMGREVPADNMRGEIWVGPNTRLPKQKRETPCELAPAHLDSTPRQEAAAKNRPRGVTASPANLLRRGGQAGLQGAPTPTRGGDPASVA